MAAMLEENPVKKVIGWLGATIGLAKSSLDVFKGTKDVKDILAKAAVLPDSKRGQAGYLKMLDFDDPYLEILDNKLENDLLNYLFTKASEASEAGTSIQDFDVNRVFEEFIVQSFDRKIAGAGEKKATDVKVMNRMGVGKARAQQVAAPVTKVLSKATGAVKDLVKGAAVDEAVVPNDISPEVSKYLSSLESNDGEKGVDSRDAKIRSRNYTVEDIMDPDTDLWE